MERNTVQNGNLNEVGTWDTFNVPIASLGSLTRKIELASAPVFGAGIAAEIIGSDSNNGTYNVTAVDGVYVTVKQTIPSSSQTNPGSMRGGTCSIASIFQDGQANWVIELVGDTSGLIGLTLTVEGTSYCDGTHSIINSNTVSGNTLYTISTTGLTAEGPGGTAYTPYPIVGYSDVRCTISFSQTVYIAPGDLSVTISGSTGNDGTYPIRETEVNGGMVTTIAALPDATADGSLTGLSALPTSSDTAKVAHACTHTSTYGTFTAGTLSIEDDGSLTVTTGEIVANVVVKDGGLLTLESGSLITGNLTRLGTDGNVGVIINANNEHVEVDITGEVSGCSGQDGSNGSPCLSVTGAGFEITVGSVTGGSGSSAGGSGGVAISLDGEGTLAVSGAIQGGNGANGGDTSAGGNGGVAVLGVAAVSSETARATVSAPTAIGGSGGDGASFASAQNPNGGNGAAGISGCFEQVTISDHTTAGDGGDGGSYEAEVNYAGAGGNGASAFICNRAPDGVTIDATNGGATGTAAAMAAGLVAEGVVFKDVVGTIEAVIGPSTAGTGSAGLLVASANASVSCGNSTSAYTGVAGVRCSAGTITINGTASGESGGIGAEQSDTGVIKPRGSILGAMSGTLDMTGEVIIPGEGDPQYWRIDHTGGTIDMTQMILRNYGRVAILSTSGVTLANNPRIVNASVNAQSWTSLEIPVTLYSGSPEYPLEENVLKDVEYAPGLSKKGTAVAEGEGAGNNPYLRIP